MSSFGGYHLPQLESGPDPLNEAAKVMQIKSMMQGQQAQAIQIQQAQQQQKDQQVLRDLYIKHQGDIDKVAQDAPRAGVSPAGMQALQLHAVEVKTKTAEMVAKQGANAVQQADLMAGAHDAVDKASPDQKPAVYAQQLAGLQRMGIDVSQMPPQYPGDAQFKFIGATVQGHKQMVADALKDREVAAQELRAKNTGGPDMAVFNALQNGQVGQQNPNVPPPDQVPQGQPQAAVPVNPPATGQAPQSEVAAPQSALPQTVPAAQPEETQAGIPGNRSLSLADKGRIQFDVSKGMSPEAAYQKLQELKQGAKPDKAVPVDQQELAAWLKKNPGKDAADYGAYKAKLVPAFNFNLQQGGAAATAAPKTADGTPLTGNDLYKSFGAKGAMVKSIIEGRQTMPAGFALKSPYWQDVMNKVYQADPQFSEQRAQIRKALTTGKAADNIGSLNTATVHLDALGEAAKALENGNFTPGNAVYNSVSKIFGSKTPTDFASLKAAVSGEMANAMKGNATDIEIRTIGTALDAANSPKQLGGVVDHFLGLNFQKLNTYKERLEQQIPGDTAYSPVLPSAAKVFEKHGIGGDTSGSQLPAQAAAQLQEGHETTFANGQIWTKKNGQPVQIK